MNRRQTNGRQVPPDPSRSGQRGDYDLEQRLLDYAVRVVRIIERLPNTRAGNHAAGQLLSCGTSPYANHGEAQAAESMRDFIHKMRVCFKELKESKRWLKFIQQVPLLHPSHELASDLQESEELIRIFAKSIQTAETRHAQEHRRPSQARPKPSVER